MAALAWKLQRIASGMRQQDMARKIGLSTTRYSAIERGEFTATALERRAIEDVLAKELPSDLYTLLGIVKPTG